MTTVKTLVDNIMGQVRPPFGMEPTIDQVVGYINDAAFDAAGQGALIHIEDDESVTFATPTISVPATFAWIRDIRYGTGYESVIPRHYWDVRIDGGVAKVFFHSALSAPAVGAALKFVGFKRPKTDYAVTMADTVDEPLVAFLRERAIFNLMQFIAVPGTEQEDALRALHSETRWKTAETILRTYLNEVQEKKYVPAPRFVPGR